MIARLTQELEQAVSAPRMAKYRPINGTDLDMVVNYFWNVCLSEALYPGLAALEIVLRNAIHDTLSAAYGTALWFYTPDLLEPRQLREFSNARLNLFHAHGNTPSAGLVVAELNFGFWTTMLSRNYHTSIWNQRHATVLRHAFPNVPRQQFQRHLIHTKFNNLRILRNRVMHHEPILFRSGLLQEHTQMLEAIGWISTTTLASIQLVDRFPDVFHNSKAKIEADIKGHLNIP